MPMINRDFGELQFNSDSFFVLSIISKWREKSKNPELIEIADSLVRMQVYVSGLNLERYSYDNVVSELRSEKNKSIMKCRELETELEKLKNFINIIKNQENEQN
tara:strand:- start:393 stop:704 length:312 start_codon:yes stop_codon:yes gene_type:complete